MGERRDGTDGMTLDEMKDKLRSEWSRVPQWATAEAAFDVVMSADAGLADRFVLQELAELLPKGTGSRDLMFCASVLTSAGLLDTAVVFTDDDGIEHPMTESLPSGHEFLHPTSGRPVEDWEDRIETYLVRTPKAIELAEANRAPSPA